MKASHEPLAQIGGCFRIETAQHFFAAVLVHGGEFPHQFLARFVFCVPARADRYGDNRGDGPDNDVRRGHDL
jgi:hypothetical protein